MSHYLLEPLQRRGLAIMGLNTRYVANDSTLIMERAIQDLGAGIGYLRRLGTSGSCCWAIRVADRLPPSIKLKQRT
jgi:hypothetical protein